MTLLERCFKTLQAAGLDVRLANAQGGACTENYCVVYDGATEPAGRTYVYRHILVDVLIPKDWAERLPDYAAQVRSALNDAGINLYMQDETRTLDDYKAIGMTMDYRVPCSL